MKARTGAAGVMAFVLLISACGSDTSVADTATVTDAVTAALVPAGATNTPFTADEAVCASTALIDTIGLARMLEIVTGLGSLGAGDPSAIFGQFTQDEQNAALPAVEQCVDMGTAIIGTLGFYGFVPDVASCLVAAMPLDPYGTSILESFLVGFDPTIDAAFSTAFLDAMVTPCRDATHGQMVSDMTNAGVSAEGAACAADAFLADDNLRDVVAVWTGVTAVTVDSTMVNDLINTTFIGCFTDDELAMLGVDTSATTTTTTTTTP
jgi:hypothetical protein